jgi:hypothetical protein
MMETFAPVPESASRKARVAFLTVCVWPDVPIEPDSSSTSMTLIPQRGGRLGFGAGVVTRTPSVSVAAVPSAPLQLLKVLGWKRTS